MESLKLFGKAWNPESVAGLSKEEFIADPAHTIEGVEATENSTSLSEVWEKSTELVKPSKKSKATMPPIEVK